MPDPLVTDRLQVAREAGAALARQHPLTEQQAEAVARTTRAAVLRKVAELSRSSSTGG